MSKPGDGRYTNYTPVQKDSSDRMMRRIAFYNAQSTVGNIYNNTGDIPVIDRAAAAANVTTAAKGYFQGVVAGDKDFFPKDVDLSFGKAPDLNDATHVAAIQSKLGGPANAYVPNLTSPGATGTDKVNLAPNYPKPVSLSNVKESGEPVNTAQEFKNNGTSVVGSGLVSPSATAAATGESSIGNNNLKLGDYVKNK